MARILLTWEMGNNLGHVSRLLPVAMTLLRDGHQVLASVCNCRIAAAAFGPAGIPFVAAPHFVAPRPIREQPVTYAGILLQQGWADAEELAGLVSGWMNLFALYRPDVLVIDHSPTALLAARIAKVPVVAIGTGFELPPLESPLPPIPGFSDLDRREAQRTENAALVHANQVLRAWNVSEIQALKNLFERALRRLTTVSELDHYGPRHAEQYIGPIGLLHRAVALEWPDDSSRRIIAYLRPQIPQLPAVLEAFKALDAAVICYAPEFPQPMVDRLRRDRLIVSTSPVAFDRLWEKSDLLISYAPAGTVAASLLRGVPQLMAPMHTEARLTAHRVECAGLGLTLLPRVSGGVVTSLIQRMLSTFDYKARALTFAKKYSALDPQRAVESLVGEIVQATT